MTGRERIMAALRGESVDRVPVNFYEIGGFKVDPDDGDPFNIYSSPSWKRLLDLAHGHTDIIRMCGIPSSGLPPFSYDSEFCNTEQSMEDGSKFTRTTIRTGGRELTQTLRRDIDVDTQWTCEHFIKSIEDIEAYLELPDEAIILDPGIEALVAEDELIGDSGIVMVDIPDPLCRAASLFPMGDFTIFALTEQPLFHALLDKISQPLYEITAQVSKKFPGHLWRIVGPEYATLPYLPPDLFNDYVVRYDTRLIEEIHRHEGFARVHCHGRIQGVLPYIVQMGADAIDPIEPPMQGDVELADVRREYGRELVLFGNLEVTDIENMEPSAFEKVVRKSIADGTSGEGRGFVLMPSASPYGRNVSERTITNYEAIVRLAGS